MRMLLSCLLLLGCDLWLLYLLRYWMLGWKLDILQLLCNLLLYRWSLLGRLILGLSIATVLPCICCLTKEFVGVLLIWIASSMLYCLLNYFILGLILMMLDSIVNNLMADCFAFFLTPFFYLTRILLWLIWGLLLFCQILGLGSFWPPYSLSSGSSLDLIDWLVVPWTLSSPLICLNWLLLLC